MINFVELIKNGAIIEIRPHKPEMMDYTPSVFFLNEDGKITAYNHEIGPCDISSVKTENEINTHFENMINEKFQVNIIPDGTPPYMMNKREKNVFDRERYLQKQQAAAPFGKTGCKY